MTYSRVSFRMTLSDLEWLSEIFSDTKHRAVSLRQLSFLFSLLLINSSQNLAAVRPFVPSPGTPSRKQQGEHVMTSLVGYLSPAGTAWFISSLELV